MADSVTIPMPTLSTEQIIAAAAEPSSSDDGNKKLRRALVGGGVGKIVAAILLGLFRSPAGVFVRSTVLFYAYYGILLAVAVFGVVEIGVGYWVSAASSSSQRRCIGKRIVWVSVVPIVFVAGIGGFGVLK
uniref:Uncharacterized protein n=1 Tax=Leersia perrieri TaxID=77586 RepID=A0A0D9WBA8_9ORYZ